MERQLGHITVIILKPSDCAACPRRLAVGETAIKTEGGYHHPSCYADALCVAHARKEDARQKARPR